MSQGASALFRLFTPVPGLRDYTCGYRLYSYDFLRRLFEYYGESLFTERGFACMADLLLKSRALRPRVGEVAMVLRYDEKLSASKMKVARTIYQTLKLLAKHTVGTRHRPVRITYGADAVRRRPSGDRSPVMSGSERED
jgi:dolichol-phosphate mannosyltransferase